MFARSLLALKVELEIFERLGRFAMYSIVRCNGTNTLIMNALASLEDAK